MLFFRPGTVEDELYRTIRDEDWPPCAEAREFIELIWSTCKPYMDQDCTSQATRSFAPRFWEMYLAWALLQRGISLYPRPLRKRSRARPDLRTLRLGAWIEAVLATPGNGANAVPELSTGEVSRVPEEESILRLRNAIDRKFLKCQEYSSKGTIGENEPFIIAVGARRIPLGRLESPIPRIVSAVFPFGHLQVHFDRITGDVVGESYQHRPAVSTASGAAVATDVFLDEKYRGISGVLYAGVDELNRPPEPGPEFIFVHNPLANSPVPHGFFQFGTEFWKEEELLRRRRH